jgi:nitroreductase
VRSAPITAVFAADLDAARGIAEVMALEAAAGRASPRAQRSFAGDAGVYASAAGSAARAALGGALCAAGALTGAPLPTPDSSEAWAAKHAGFAAMSYMLACTAAGLATHAMEGFDARLVREATGLEEPLRGCGGGLGGAGRPRWAVPLIISTGYAEEEGAGAGAGASGGGGGSGARAHRRGGPSPRLPPARVFFLNRAQAPFPGFGESSEGAGAGAGAEPEVAGGKGWWDA